MMIRGWLDDCLRWLCCDPRVARGWSGSGSVVVRRWSEGDLVVVRGWLSGGSGCPGDGLEWLGGSLWVARWWFAGGPRVA